MLQLWNLFEFAGTIAFAVSGAIVGMTRNMDVFGITVLAVLTAVGGGMIRDVLAGYTPPMALENPGNLLLSVLTALTIVLGMRMMGAMLISSLVIFPALSAMRVEKSFRGVVVLAGVLSVLGFCAGLTGSYLLSTPVGASVVVVDLLIFLLCCGVRRVRG